MFEISWHGNLLNLVIKNIRNHTPYFIRKRLWGDRRKWGQIPNKIDPCWIEWQQMQTQFYNANQRQGIGSIVNDSGYSVMSSIDLKGKPVLEF